jgi:hypothetical protein
MKHLTLDRRGHIDRITDTAPEWHAPEATVMEVSDEVAEQAATMMAAKEIPLWLDGALTSRAAQRAAGVRLRWDDTAKVWNKVSIVVPVPPSITASQLRRQLRVDGKVAVPLECTEVQAIIATLPPPLNLDVAAQFDYEVNFLRANPLVIQLAAALGYDTDAKLDAFFVAAGKL